MLVHPASFLLLVLPGDGAMELQECRQFRQCYDLAAEAGERGDVELATRYYSIACATPVERVYGALQIAACERIIDLSGTSDDYTTAEAYFGRRCEGGSDQACFFLGKIAEERDSLAAALAIMRPLCDERFELPAVHGYEACTHVRRLERTTEVRQPDIERTGPIQVAAFFAIFVMSAMSGAVFLRFVVSKQNGLAAASVVLSVLAVASYGYYETGIPSHYAIRVDLLLIFPALIVNLFLIGAAVIGAALMRRKASRTTSP
jgi:TPR repeat protein